MPGKALTVTVSPGLVIVLHYVSQRIFQALVLLCISMVTKVVIAY